MEIHSRAFAEVDQCPRCQGAFLDPGEGVAVHGAHAEPSFLLEDGRARLKGRSELRCPAHGAPNGAGAGGPFLHAAPSAPLMDIYVIGADPDAIEIDYCGTCGGFYLDAGEGAALLELAERAEQVIRSRTGAEFAAPPADHQDRVVDEARERKGKGLFAEMVKGLIYGSVQYRRHRRRHHDRHCDYDRLYVDWK